MHHEPKISLTLLQQSSNIKIVSRLPTSRLPLLKLFKTRLLKNRDSFAKSLALTQARYAITTEQLWTEVQALQDLLAVVRRQELGESLGGSGVLDIISGFNVLSYAYTTTITAL
jgi:hypothetical protein